MVVMVAVVGSFVCCSVVVLFVCCCVVVVLFEGFKVACVCVWSCVKIMARLVDVVLVWLLVGLFGVVWITFILVGWVVDKGVVVGK